MYYLILLILLLGYCSVLTCAFFNFNLILVILSGIFFGFLGYPFINYFFHSKREIELLEMKSEMASLTLMRALLENAHKFEE